MKNYMKSIMAVAALLLCSTVTQAGDVTVITQVDGQTSTAGGTATADKSSNISGGETVTITVTPNQGYYLNTITVVKTIDGSQAQTRAPGFSEPLTVTHASGSDVTGTATYTFVMPETGVDGVTYDAEVTVNFSQRTSIADATVTATGTFTYTGEAIVPKTITVKLGSTTLTVTTDYTLEISDNTDSGTATITATGVGTYTGTATGEFTIGQASIDAVTLDKTTLTYTGAEQTVTVTKVMAGDVELTADDYTVSGNKGTNAGTYTVTVTAKEGSNFTGSKTAEFTIGQATIDAVTLDKTTLDYTGAEQTVSVTKVMAGTIELTADDYTVSGNKSTNAGTYTVTVTAKDGSNFTGSKTAEFTIGQATIDAVTLDKTTLDYTGAEQSVTVTKVMAGTIELTADDYTVSGNKGTNAGTYTVTVTAKEGSNFTGSKTAEFTIGQATIDAVTLDKTTLDYTGAEQTVTVTKVMAGTIELTADDYTISGNKASDAGTYTVTVTAKDGSNFKAKATLAFDKDKAEATYGAAFTAPTLTKTPATLEGVTFKSSDTDVATVDNDGKVTIEGTGETVITASFAGNDNYEAAEASYTLTVNPGKMEVTAEGYEGTYDGQPHGITLNVPEGATVEYTFSGYLSDGTSVRGDWSTIAPTFTDAGEYTVEYRVMKDNDEDVEGDAKVIIYKAPVEITKEPTAIEGLVYTGEPQVLITAGECGTGGTMMYALNSITGDAWSENLPTATEAGTYTVYYSVSSDDDNHRYQGDTKSLTVTIAPKEEEPEPEPGENTYNLWIGGVQVTDQNKTNILGDGINKARFFFDDKSSQLVITNNQDASIAIESGLDELTIFLNGSEPSYLNRIWSNVGGREVIHEAKGKLTITTYPNIPGMLYLETDHLMGVIGYFSSLTIDESTNTVLMDPAGGSYDGALLTAEGEIAKSATIGQYIVPMTYETKTFPASNFLNPDGSDKDLSNTTVDNENKILLTANTEARNPDENDGYDSTDNSIVLNTTLTTKGVEQVAAEVVAGTLVPGTGDFARVFHGITFMVPDGSGEIYLNVSVENGYRLRVKVIGDTSGTYSTVRQSTTTAVINYQVSEASYVLVWLERDANYSREDTRGRRETAHGRVYSVRLVPEQVEEEIACLYGGRPVAAAGETEQNSNQHTI